MRNLLIVLLTAFMVVGCASMNDVKINSSFDKAIETHDKEQTKVAVGKARSIKDMFNELKCDDGTAACGTANALIVVVASERIAEIETKPFEQKRPTTSLDVQEKGLETLSDIALPTVTGVVAVKAIDRDKGSVKNVSNGSGNASSNYDEDHATALGDGTNSTNNGNSPSSTTELRE